MTLALVGGVVGVAGWRAWSRADDPTTAATAIRAPTSAPTPEVAASASITPRVGPAHAGAGASPSPSTSAVRQAASKKGAGVASSFDGMGTALSDSGVSWYYNWASSSDISAPAGVEYVPMIWGANDATSSTLSAVKRRGGTLLGFNEPDVADQSNISVDQALDLWPTLMATGARLGSPAASTGLATDGSWFDQFMRGAKSKGYRVDFIAAHWYGADFDSPVTAANQLKTYLQATYAKWKKPIWLTEYALIDFFGPQKYPSQAQQVAFVAAATTMLRALPYVERHAWFHFSPQTDGTEGTALYQSGGAPTTVGTAYRAAS